MAPYQENTRSYSKLAQIYNSFQEDYPTVRMVGNVLEKEGDINFKIPLNSPARFFEPSLAGCTALHIAALKNEPLILDILLKKGADFTAQDSKGRSVLHYLIDLPNLRTKFIHNILSMHQSYGNPYNPCDVNGLSHFHIACKYNFVDVVEFFLNCGIPVDMAVTSGVTRFAGFTPLHFAAKSMALATIDALLKHNANIDVKDARGLTPFHILLEEKIKELDRYNAQDTKMSCEMVTAIDEAMNLLLDSNDVDDIGLTQLHIACTQRDSSVAEYFLEQVADIDQPVRMDSPIRPGYTALHFAAHCNFVIVKMLLKKKANCEVRDANGMTPMDLIWEKCNPRDIQTILEQNWKYIMFSDQQCRLLEFFRVTGEAKVMEHYLKHVNDITMTMGGAGHEAAYWTGRTLLHFAVMFCKSNDIIEVCMKQGLSELINVQDFYGSTPIHLAFRMKKFDFVKILIEHCQIFVNVVDNEGLSYLHIACALESVNFFNQILHVNNSKVVYHGKSTYGWITPGSTALHVAVTSKNSGLIRNLLQHGFDLEDKDASGQTPLHRFVRLSESLDKEPTKLLSLSDELHKHPNNTEIICSILLSSKTLTDRLAEEVGLTRLHMAIYCEEFPLQKFLNTNNINAVIKCNDPSSFLFSYDGCTPLHMAIRKGAEISVVNELLNYGADLLAKNHRGETPLYDIMINHCSDTSLMSIIFGELQCKNDLQRQMEKISGITMLHIACFLANSHFIAQLLIEQVDVNVRVRSDCPIWPNCTPLHLLMKSIERTGVSGNICYIFETILAAGAEVTAMDGNNETPIHLSLRNFSTPCADKVVMPLLKNLRVFNENPVDQNGISHFHAACLVNNVEVVKTFLESGVDVNQPIDFFAKNFAGETPLHLAVDHRTETLSNDPEYKQETVQLLINYGADVSAEDSLGQTAFHKAVKLSGHLNILEKFVELGAAINAQNIFEKIPLESLMQSENVSAEKIKFFEKYGCRLNDSSPLTEQGFISMLISQNYHKNLNDVKSQPNNVARHAKEVITQCFVAILNAPDSLKFDDMGRNLIHNIVTTNNPYCKIFSYDKLIKQFQSAGMDIELQDKKGKTALHLATQFGNHAAVSDLLNNGVDINILDATNKTALSYAVEYYNNDKYCSEKKCHKQVIIELISHLLRLQELDLEISQNNILEEEYIYIYIFGDDLSSIYDCYDKANVTSLLRNIRKFHIVDEPKLLLKDFLSETGKGLTSYPFMTDSSRERVDLFFRDYTDDYRDVCMLQYRKTIKRMLLVIQAINSMWKIARSAVPIICLQSIFKYLKNSELENLIKATTIEPDNSNKSS